MRKSRFLPFLLGALGLAFLIPTASSLYLVNQASMRYDFDIVKGNERAVAVIDSEPGVYYASVEGALRSATSKVSDAGENQTVYVLPGISNDSNPIVIDENCVVSSGVVLCLPYAQSGETFTHGFEHSEAKDIYGSGTNFADSTPPSLSNTNRKTLVLLEKGVNLKIESGGRLIVGGALGTGSGSSNTLGMTSGSYAELAMASASSIDCLGTFDVRGYVKPWDESDDDGENGCRITIGTSSSSGAALSLPLVFYGFEGGSKVLAGDGSAGNPFSWDGSALNGVFPFEIFDMPNVSVPYTVYEGNSVNCTYAFQMSFQGTTYTLGGPLNLLGEENAIMTLTSEGSSMSFDYEPAATYEVSRFEAGVETTIHRGLSINDARCLKNGSGWPAGASISETGMARTKAVISGSARTNDVTISFKGLNIDFGITIPIGDGIEISTGGGRVFGLLSYDTLAIPFSYKWDIGVGGGTMSIPNHVKFLPGANLQLMPGGTLSVAGEFVSVGANEAISPYYPTASRDKATISECVILNNGSIEVGSGGRFGSEVATSVSGATVTFAGGANQTNSTADAYEPSYKSAAGVYGPRNFASKAYIGASGDSATLKPFSGEGEAFVSKAGGSAGYYFGYPTSTLGIETNGIEGVDIQIDGVSADYSSGSLQIKTGATVRLVFDYAALGELRFDLDGTPLDLVPEGNDHVSASFAPGVGHHLVEFYKAEPISFSGAKAHIADEHRSFTITWQIKNVVGDVVDSGTYAVDQSGTLDYTLFSAAKTVYPGWIFTVSAGNPGSGDTASISSIASSGGGSASGSTYTFSSSDNNATLTVNVGYSGCIVEGTLIDMADGTSKKVEDLEVGDMVMAFDHEMGQEVASPILCVDVEEKAEYLVSDLLFSDGTSIGIAFEHGFFDRTLNRYVYLTPENAEEYVGHAFYSLGGESLVLEEVETSRKEVALYSPVTAYTMNLFHEGLLGMPGGVEGFFNVFEYGEDMAYDPVKKAEDIAKYGLYTYEDVSDLISREAFDLLPIPYLKVAVGKGIIAWEDIVRMARMFADLLPQ